MNIFLWCYVECDYGYGGGKVSLRVTTSCEKWSAGTSIIFPPRSNPKESFSLGGEVLNEYSMV